MMPKQLRQLFMVLVTSREIIQPHKLWMDFRDHLSEDFLYWARQVNPEAEFDDLIYSRALTVIEDHILSSGGKTLDEYGFPPFERVTDVATDGEVPREVLQETSYDQASLQATIDQRTPNPKSSKDMQLKLY